MQKEIDNRDGKCDVAQRLSASWRSVRVGIFSFTVFFGLAASAFAGSTSSYQVNGSAGSVQNGVDIGLLNSANGVLRGTVNNNNIILGAGSSLDPNYVFGGLNVQTSANSAVSGNKLTISGGAVVSSADAYSGTVTGGFAFSETGNASALSNYITINHGLLDGALTAGWARVNTGSGSASANNNTIYMNGGEVAGDGLTGGWAEAYAGSAATANANTVLMSGGVVDSGAGAAGGWAYLEADSGVAAANSNILTLSGGQILNSNYNAAGNASLKSASASGVGQAIASNNKISLSGNALIDNGGALVGGWARAEDGLGTATANNNQAIMSGGIVQGGGDIYSGYGSVIGGWAELYYGEDVAPAPALASGNTALMSGGAIKDGGNLVGGWARAHDGYGSATAINNTVNMSGGTISDSGGSGASAYDGSIFGGYVRVSSLGDEEGVALASGNTVNMSGGAIQDGGHIYGGFTYAYKNVGQSVKNAVNLTGGAVDGDVYGGWARVTTGQAVASSNTVAISSGSNVGGNVYGGHAQASTGGQVAATGNTVIISGAPSFDAASTLYGGYATINSAAQTTFSHVIAGNTLTLNNTNISVGGVKNFENYNFLLPQNIAKPMLSSTSAVALSGSASSWQSNVALLGVSGGQKLNPGTAITLIDNVDPTDRDFKVNGESFSPNNNTVKGVKQGIALKYDMTLAFDGNTLNAKIANVEAAEDARAPMEGRAASLGFLAGGSDLIAGAGMEHAMIAGSTINPDQGLASGDAPAMGLKPFAAITGGVMRYNTGGHVNVNGLSYMLGLAKSVEVGPGSLLGGLFFENGYGSYRSHYSAGDGDGQTSYYGGGVLGRYDFTSGALEGLYSEASFRVGSLHNEYRGEARTGLDSGRYTTNTLYYGAHAGLGYVCELTEDATLDTSVKYLWAHQNSADATILGDDFKFKATDSYRLRPGARLTYAITDEIKPYIGGAYEYEFGGKARATTYGLDIAAPSVKGSTGMGELGLSITPASDQALRVDFGVQTYFGKREGVMGTASLSYEF